MLYSKSATVNFLIKTVRVSLKVEKLDKKHFYLYQFHSSFSSISFVFCCFPHFSCVCFFHNFALYFIPFVLVSVYVCVLLCVCVVLCCIKHYHLCLCRCFFRSYPLCFPLYMSAFASVKKYEGKK